MDFASSYVLDEDSGEDFFDDNALNDKEESSGSAEEEDLSDEEVVPASEQKQLRKVRKADTNLLAVNLGSLAEGAEVFTGEITFCSSCKAVLSALSKLEHNLWVCEYCGTENKIDLEEEEIPKSLSVDYLLEPPKETSEGGQDDIVVFCIDVSGSMCCTSEVNSGEFKIRQDKALEESLRQFMDVAPGGGFADQFFPGQTRDVTYVSRLQCVQAAVSDQIEKMAIENPNKRVAVVSFSNDVTIYLPGGTNHVITGDHLHDYDYLLGCPGRLGIELKHNVKEKEQEIISSILGLNESGATALGPALLTAIGIAGIKRGSSVVLCTDGIANVGLGSLESLTKENVATHPAPSFYRKLTDTALGLGVAVSVLSIKGENARLEYIAKVAADTRGFNDIVDPLNLTTGFNFILENKIVAIDVNVTLLLHKGLKVRHEKVIEEGITSRVVRNIGNCTSSSALTFEYSRRKGVDLSSFSAIPFQIQISYTKPDGTKCMRVVAKEVKVTKSREEAEAHVNVAVVGLHSQQQTAKLVTRGDYTKARMKQKSNMRMVRRGMKSNPQAEEQKGHYSEWNSEAVKLNKFIKEKKKKEKKAGRLYHSAEDDESCSGEDYDSDDGGNFFADDAPTEEVKEKAERKTARKLDRCEDDCLSNAVYQAQNPMFSFYKKK